MHMNLSVSEAVYSTCVKWCVSEAMCVALTVMRGPRTVRPASPAVDGVTFHTCARFTEHILSALLGD